MRTIECGGELQEGLLTRPIDLFENDELGNLQRCRDPFAEYQYNSLPCVTKGLTSVEPGQEKSLLEHAAYVDECKGTNLNKD